MTTDRWQDVRDIFEQALDQPEGDRGTFVAEACGGDADLERDVLSLLEHDRRAEAGFMRAPALDPSACHAETADGADSLIETRIGRFHIRAVIASGGMGTVYEAEQEDPRRIVALKVMRPGMLPSYALRHFRREAQILAMLRHAHIAQVYEAGTHRLEHLDGRTVPYFVMEYVPGAQRLTQYAETHDLDTAQRIELFTKACDAIHHGHQKGVIHRDLKPANILVDESGTVKVIDFGVARATDSDIALTTIEADTGRLVGTLQYMSPEQCQANPLEIDTRSDVYSLGVVLYELLCSELPYEVTGTSVPVAARTICELEPARPSSIDRKLRGDLEIILLKALEKDREKRYQSPADLARDLRHYVHGEPIEASPPTTWFRVFRWTRRHPAATHGRCVHRPRRGGRDLRRRVGVVPERPTGSNRPEQQRAYGTPAVQSRERTPHMVR